MNRSEALRYRSIIIKAAESLTDEEALKVPLLFERWEPANHYAIGKRLYYDGVLYSVLIEHDSHEAYTPDISVSLYARVLIPDPGVIPEWEQPGSTNPYMKDDKVRHNGHIWISMIDYNVYEPGVFGWSVIDE